MKDDVFNVLQIALWSQISKKFEYLKIAGGTNNENAIRVESDFDERMEEEEEEEEETGDGVILTWNSSQLLLSNIYDLKDCRVIYHYRNGSFLGVGVEYDLSDVKEGQSFIISYPRSNLWSLNYMSVFLDKLDLSADYKITDESGTTTITNDMFHLPEATADDYTLLQFNAVFEINTDESVSTKRFRLHITVNDNLVLSSISVGDTDRWNVYDEYHYVDENEAICAIRCNYDNVDYICNNTIHAFNISYDHAYICIPMSEVR